MEPSLADKQLAVAALRRRAAGEKPSAKELAALKRVERAKEEEIRWLYYRSIPQKHWVEMSGRQAKILQEQAARYGIPFADAVIDLPRVVRAIHDFFAANKYRFRDDEDPVDGADASPALERYRAAKAELAELDLANRRGALVDRALLTDLLRPFFEGLKNTAEALRRRFGDEAASIFERGRRDAETGVLAALEREEESEEDDAPGPVSPNDTAAVCRPGPPAGDAADAQPT